MKFITKRTSKTGKKFMALLDKIQECRVAQNKMSKEIGFSEWRGAYHVSFGGVSSVIFKDKKSVDKKVWKNVNGSDNEWMPRLNTKIGKGIYLKLKSLPTISKEELNDCVGFKGNPFQSIGVNFTNKDFIGFELIEKWEYKAPEDCEEVTVTRYNKLFKINS